MGVRIYSCNCTYVLGNCYSIKVILGLHWWQVQVALVPPGDEMSEVTEVVSRCFHHRQLGVKNVSRVEGEKSVQGCLLAQDIFQI